MDVNADIDICGHVQIFVRLQLLQYGLDLLIYLIFCLQKKSFIDLVGYICCQLL